VSHSITGTWPQLPVDGRNAIEYEQNDVGQLGERDRYEE
jgi:hypothetical protein